MKSMKKSFALVASVCCAIFVVSCEREVTSYSDVLEIEKMIIDGFMDEHGFKVVKEYPKEGAFGDKEFVLLENGVYLHVIDSGNGNRPVHGTKVSSLAKGLIFDKSTTTEFNGFQPNDKWAKWPLIFKFESVATPFDDNYFLGEGYTNVMKYVGDSSSVSLIVPFTVGSLYQRSTCMPIYFEKVNFTFVK